MVSRFELNSIFGPDTPLVTPFFQKYYLTTYNVHFCNEYGTHFISLFPNGRSLKISADGLSNANIYIYFGSKIFSFNTIYLNLYSEPNFKFYKINLYKQWN